MKRTIATLLTLAPLAVALLLSTPLLAGCGGGLRPFPLKAPIWVDMDKRPFTQEPEEYFSSFLWDGADQMAFRPFAKFWKVDPGKEAVNVNALDEVPDSAWFVNRIGRYGMTLEQARRGPCEGPALDPKGPWIVTGAKPNGANPGFPVKGPDGRRYMVKFDGVVQGPRATAADVIVSKIYYAAGFSAPCNEVVFFDRKILQIDPEAESENEAGDKVPMSQEDLDTIFSKAIRLPDGRYRASTSLYLKGKPIGPFRYESTRDDDPNDVIAHEDRRDLRGTYVLAAWTNHFDSREQNTLDMFVQIEGKGGYVQHSILDFGDCLGSIWEPPMLGRRVGHSHYLAADHVFIDLITFGIIDRPWDRNRFGKTKAFLGYYQIDNFVPDQYRPGYPNPAMLRMTERDGAWMARIVARMTPLHVQAMIQAGKLQDEALEDELTEVLLGRRQKVLARWLSRVSALTDPRLVVTAHGAGLCMEDLAVTSGVSPLALRSYQARAWLGERLTPQPLTLAQRSPSVCVPLPAIDQGTAASPDHPRYLIIDLYAYAGSQSRNPARVHLYHLGGTNYRIVGLERPDHDAPPG